MRTTRVFRSGNSQAVRLPKEFRFDDGEVEIFRRGEEVVLRRKPRNLAAAFEILARFPEDFLAAGTRDEPPRVREDL